VQWLLPATGWKLNDKCEWEPSRVRDFLGFTLDTSKFTVHVKTSRLDRACTAITTAANTGLVATDELESLIGQLVSMTPAIKEAQMMTRALNRLRTEADRKGLETCYLKPQSEAEAEIAFWKSDLRKRNGRRIIPNAAVVEWRCESAVGATARTLTSDEVRRWAKPLTPDMIGRSSTERELYGVLRATQTVCLKSFASTPKSLMNAIKKHEC
jgi:hypothetical protein